MIEADALKCIFYDFEKSNNFLKAYVLFKLPNIVSK